MSLIINEKFLNHKNIMKNYLLLLNYKISFKIIQYQLIVVIKVPIKKERFKSVIKVSVPS